MRLHNTSLLPRLSLAWDYKANTTPAWFYYSTSVCHVIKVILFTMQSVSCGIPSVGVVISDQSAFKTWYGTTKDEYCYTNLISLSNTATNNNGCLTVTTE